MRMRAFHILKFHNDCVAYIDGYANYLSQTQAALCQIDSGPWMFLVFMVFAGLNYLLLCISSAKFRQYIWMNG